MKYVFTLILAIVLLGCDNPLSKKYDKDTLQEDLKLIIQAKNDTVEAKLILGTIMRYTLTNNSLKKDITYQELLEDGEKFREKLLKQDAEEKERKQKLLSSFAVSISNIYLNYYDDNKTRKEFLFAVILENLSDKDVSSIKGSFRISDLSDAYITSFDVTIDCPISPSESIQNHYGKDYDRFSEEDELLASQKFEDLKITWKPEKITFKDGSVLE